MENSFDNKQDKGLDENRENKDSDLEKNKIRFQSMFEILEDSILQKRFTSSDMGLADIEDQIKRAKSEGVDFSSIQDFEKRISRLRMEAGKIAVLSCLEKAKLAIKTKDTNPNLLASWYFATEEKLNECKGKGLISPSDLILIEEEIKNFRTSFLLGVIANPEDDYNIQREKESEELEKKIIKIYEVNLETTERYINEGNLDVARRDFNNLNELLLEKVINNKFLTPELQERIDNIREKLEVEE